MSTSMAFWLFIDKTFSLEDAYCFQLPLKYIYVIIRNSLGCNIVDDTNQLSFAYKALAYKFQVFVTSLINTIKATDFICVLKEKKEI